MKGLYLNILLAGISSIINAQDSQSFKILPFNEEEFEKRLPIFELMETVELPLDTLALKSHNRFPMRMIEPPLKEIAPMPNMPIRDDIHYHMKIKDYINCYAPEKRKYDYKKLTLDE